MFEFPGKVDLLERYSCCWTLARVRGPVLYLLKFLLRAADFGLPYLLLLLHTLLKVSEHALLGGQALRQGPLCGGPAPHKHTTELSCPFSLSL